MPASPPGTASARRPVRHLPGRSVPAIGRLRRGQAARGRRLRRRGAGRADLLRPAGLQLRRPGRRPRDRAPGDRGLRGATTTWWRRRARAPACSSVHYPGLFDGRPGAGQARAAAFAGKVHELISLPRRRARRDGGRRRASTAASPITTPARACASSASATQPRRAAGLGRGPASSSRWRTPTSAAASAAPSASSIPTSPTPSSSARPSTIAATGADTLLAGDLGCLMNMAGKLQRQGRQVQARHVAEVLAGELADPADRRAARALMQSTSPAFKENARAALADAQLQKALASVAAGLRRQRAAPRAPALPEFEALRDRGRDIKNHTLAHLDLYLEAFESEGQRGRRPRCTSRRPPTTRATIILEICRDGGRPRRHQGQVDGRRGDRPQRPPRGARHRRRSRPISANTSSSSATSRRATSSRRPSTSRKEQVEADFRRLHTDLPHGSRPDRADRSWSPRRATILREKFLAADVGITGANFLIAETGSSVHRHQRGQRRPDPDAAAVHIVLASHREDGADAGGRDQLLRAAGALGDRPGDLGLHDVLDRPAARRRPRRARASTTSSSSTTAARRCSAPSSRRCCAASAAAPA